MSVGRLARTGGHSAPPPPVRTHLFLFFFPTQKQLSGTQKPGGEVGEREAAAALITNCRPMWVDAENEFILVPPLFVFTVFSRVSSFARASCARVRYNAIPTGRAKSVEEKWE